MSLRRRLVWATSVSALVLLAALVTLVLTLVAASRSVDDETRRIGPASQVAAELLSSLVDQEISLRGYALDPQQRFLDQITAAGVRETNARAQLGRLVPRGDLAADAVDAEDRARAAWHDGYVTPRLIALRQGRSSDVSSLSGDRLFGAIRQASGLTQSLLGQELRASQRRVQRDRDYVVAAVATIIVAVLVAMVLLAVGLRRWITRPLDDLSHQLRRVAGGERDLALAILGPPDLRALAGDADTMRLELMSALADVRRGQDELARSNSDLEQFAYVASHDLQEPLRKVASFCQLLEQRYGEQLDERGLQYLAFAVDGAKRMQQLIADLLTFSRVGRSADTFVSTPLAEVFRTAGLAVEARREETGGVLEVAELPAVLGDPSLLHLLAQNLLGNALKFHRPDVPPVVRVSAQVEGCWAHVRVEDNGIGISPDYAEKVFVIFQRLHGRDEYEGTGIGLALVKKVVEFHGGTIDLVPSVLGGAGFAFTLPVAP